MESRTDSHRNTGTGYNNQRPDWKRLAPLATGAGPGRDLELHLGCWACTPHPNTSIATTTMRRFLNPLGGSTPTAATLRRTVRCMEEAGQSPRNPRLKTPSNAMSAVVVKYDDIRLHIACHRGEATTSHWWSVDFAVMKAVRQARRLLPRPIRPHFLLIRRDSPQYYLRNAWIIYSVYVYDTSSCLELSNFVISLLLKPLPYQLETEALRKVEYCEYWHPKTKQNAYFHRYEKVQDIWSWPPTPKSSRTRPTKKCMDPRIDPPTPQLI